MVFGQCRQSDVHLSGLVWCCDRGWQFPTNMDWCRKLRSVVRSLPSLPLHRNTVCVRTHVPIFSGSFDDLKPQCSSHLCGSESCTSWINYFKAFITSVCAGSGKVTDLIHCRWDAGKSSFWFFRLTFRTSTRNVALGGWGKDCRVVFSKETFAINFTPAWWSMSFERGIETFSSTL